MKKENFIGFVIPLQLTVFSIQDAKSQLFFNLQAKVHLYGSCSICFTPLFVILFCPLFYLAYE